MNKWCTDWDGVDEGGCTCEIKAGKAEGKDNETRNIKWMEAVLYDKLELSF